MRRHLSIIAVPAAVLLAAPSLPANTIISTYPYVSGLITSGWPEVAQSFVTPNDNMLLNYRTYIAPSNAAPMLFEIVPWSTNTGPIGDPLFSTQMPWPQNGELVVTNINLALTPGVRYAAVMDFGNYYGQSVRLELTPDGYPQGTGGWALGGTWYHLNDGYETIFKAEFAPVPEPKTLTLLFLPLALALKSRITSGRTNRTNVPRNRPGVISSSANI